MSDDDWTVGPADESPEAEADRDQPPELAFYSLPEFVEDFFLQVAARHTLSENWCPMWWDHEEAVLRLEALWDAFEALRLEPGTGTAVWIRDFLDPTVSALTNPETTPFRRCNVRRNEHLAEEPWPAAPAPDGMFRNYATAED